MTSKNLQHTAPPNDRALPVVGRRDLKVQEIQFQGGSWKIVKDPLSLKYFRLRREELRVVELLDGTISLEELHRRLRSEFPASRTTRAELQALIADLAYKGLIRSTRAGRGTSILRDQKKLEKSRLLQAILSPFFIKFPGWDAQPTLERIYPRTRWMFQPWVVALALLFIVTSWLQLSIRLDDVYGRFSTLSGFFRPGNLVLLWLTLGVTKVIHELAHGLACRHFGGECHEIGVSLLVFSPCLYCDVSDTWMLPRKRDRILVAAAGIYIEVLVSALALTLWSWTQPGLLNFLLLNIFMVTTVSTVIYNANPLLRYDGYYILSDWLEIPNLRAKADQEIRQLFLKLCTGVSPPISQHAPTGSRHWFVAYAFAATLNRCILAAAIFGFLYHLLRPYGLQNLAIFAASVSVAVCLYRVSAACFRSLSLAGENTVNPMRIAMTVMTLIGLICAGVFVPLPIHGHAPLIIEPAGMRNVYSQVEGAVEKILVRPGTTVIAGQPLLRLRNDALEAELAKLQAIARKRHLDAAVARSLDDSAGLELAGESIKSAEEELDSLQDRINRLTVNAPYGGVLITPSTTTAISSVNSAAARDAMDKFPLNQKNAGMWLPAGTLIACIAASGNQWQAKLFVDQEGGEKLQTEAQVEIKLSGRPCDTLHGHVSSVASREENSVTAANLIRSAGTPASITDPLTGRQRFASAVYQATVLIDNEDVDLITGMHGMGRFHVSRPSLAGWIEKYFRQTINTSH